jgi:hypothetical protein
MEQLITRDQQTGGRMIEVAMVMRKVEFRLSKEQLAALGRIMSSYLANLSLHSIDGKALFYLLYAIYESKVRKKMFSLKPDMKLSFDMAQAWAMVAMIQEMQLDQWPYEYQLGQYIISEIDHQTA